eukprot:TRINITY_DN8174_c0_g1_i1.p1 TRINITY_DN8174_c0_g1~~TRINITY_DN8174_c0_g1_i1.p1  ORF type:complete len:246 (-),score=38.19 TRINITY_DN8174_c0_g1_i1:53-790(-)
MRTTQDEVMMIAPRMGSPFGAHVISENEAQAEMYISEINDGNKRLDWSETAAEDQSHLRPFPQDKYRTQPCKFFFQTGQCAKGDRCNFSHDEEILLKRRPSMNWPQFPMVVYSMPPNFPMDQSYPVNEPSSFQGYPQFMPQFFLPEDYMQYGAPPMPFAMPFFPPMTPPRNKGKDVPGPKYRTKPCTFFMTSGRCLKGDRCNFSHDLVNPDSQDATFPLESYAEVTFEQSMGEMSLNEDVSSKSS